MLANYNFLLKLWEQRNQNMEKFNKKLISQSGGKVFTTLTYSEIVSSVGKSEFAVLIDLTERVISLTDDLIIEINDFLLNFPLSAKKLINLKRLRKYGALIIYSNNDNKILLDLIDRNPAVDISKLEYLFGESSAEIKQRLKTGYEHE